MANPQISSIKYQVSDQRSVFITGPTASGKSDLAMRVAREFNGEIICADSQTVRRGMDIGTAKPSQADRAEIPHHLLDIVEPNERFSVHQFKQLAEDAITDTQARGRLPVIVGGSGLYVYALLYEFSLRPSTSEYARAELESMGVAQLQEIVVRKGYTMPENEHNPRHLIRTIETEGVAPQERALREGTIVVGIDPGKEVLERRIEERADKMISAGLIAEVKGLIRQYGAPKERFDAIQYNVAYENRGADADILKEKFVIGDRQYAKKQRSWFRRNEDITWFETPDVACEYIEKLLLQN